MLSLAKIGRPIICQNRGIKKIPYPFSKKMDPDGATGRGQDENLYADRYLTRFHPDTATQVDNHFWHDFWPFFAYILV